MSGEQVRTRAATLPRYVNDLATLLATGQALLQPELPIEIRLMGIRMSSFQERRLDSGQRSIASFVSQPGNSRADHQQQQQAGSPQDSALQGVEGLEDLGEADDGLAAAVEDEHRDWNSLDPELEEQVQAAVAEISTALKSGPMYALPCMSTEDSLVVLCARAAHILYVSWALIGDDIESAPAGRGTCTTQMSPTKAQATRSRKAGAPGAA